MEEVPRRGIYKCPVHGCFAHELNGVVLPWTNCPIECLSMNASSENFVQIPCGLRSPLASNPDIDVNKQLDGMDDNTWETFKAAILEERAKNAAETSIVPASIYGKRWRRVGDDLEERLKAGMEEVIQKQKAENACIARDMFETIEREKMKLAMSEAGIEI